MDKLAVAVVLVPDVVVCVVAGRSVSVVSGSLVIRLVSVCIVSVVSWALQYTNLHVHKNCANTVQGLKGIFSYP